MSSDRRRDYRDFMRRMDPTGEPSIALQSGFYVEPPDGVGKRLASRLDIEPASTHLVVGGIGSGKSTELLAVHRHLSESTDVICFRVDVLAEQRIVHLQAGVLAGLAGVAIASWIESDFGDAANEDTVRAVKQVRAIANGQWTSRWEHDEHDEHDYEPDDEVWVEGVLKRPSRNDVVYQLQEAIAVLLAACGRSFVVLFDGLDRMRNLDTFVKSVGHDVPALKMAGVGVVVIGPQQLRLTKHRFILEYFTQFHLHGAAAFLGAEGQAFLGKVLRARDPAGLIEDDLLAAVATWSGGLLRDLISLAKSAAEEAYSAGHSSIQKSDIDTAADGFGRSLLLSVNSSMGERLKELVPKKASGRFESKPKPKSRPAFILESEVDIELLYRRLIIEVPGVPVIYVPHPTLIPLVRLFQGA